MASQIKTNKKSTKIKSQGTASEVKDSSLISQSIDPTLSDAVRALQNNARTIVETKGCGTSVHTHFPTELLTAMRGLFPSSRCYDFEIHGSATLATIGGGVFNTNVGWNPASTTFAEWTALAALFDEVKLVSSRLDLTSAFGPTSSAIIFQVAVAPDFDGSAGGTPSFTAVQRLAESEYIHCYNLGRGGPGRFRKTTIIRDRPFALTSTPGGASGTPSGCIGDWALASNIVGTASINYLFAIIKNVVRLRNRA